LAEEEKLLIETVNSWEGTITQEKEFKLKDDFLGGEFAKFCQIITDKNAKLFVKYIKGGWIKYPRGIVAARPNIIRGTNLVSIKIVPTASTSIKIYVSTNPNTETVEIAESETTVSPTPICKFGYVSTSSSSYQTLATWTVSTGKKGLLKDISFAPDSTSFGVAQFKVVVAGETLFEDIKAIGGVSLPLDGLVTLSASDVVTVSVKSDGSTTITANGSITGREV